MILEIHLFDELPMFVGFSCDLAAALARLQLAKLQVDVGVAT
eukprot:COSAG02_NODE_34408_length_484_cov_1.371429_2_plen_42_part_00